MKTIETRMTVLALVAFSICAAQLARGADTTSAPTVSASWSGSFRGRVYSTDLLGSMFRDTPRWATTEPNPPLSVRAAESSASNALSKVVGDMKAWRRQEIVLDDWTQGYWTYRFHYDGPSFQTTNISSRLTNIMLRASSLSVVVLMNGEAIAPTPKATNQSK